MKLKNWLVEWLENYVKPTVKSRTYERYTYIVLQKLIPSLGERELEDLTPTTLQKFVTQLLASGNAKTGEGLATNSVNSIVNVIQNAMRTAFNVGYAASYTADKLKRPKAKERRVECFTVAEQKKIVKAALSSKKSKLFGVALCLYTGLRLGELLALKWSDIDVIGGLLSVNRSCHDGKWLGKTIRVEEPPKTESSIRVIPLPKQLLPIVREKKKASVSPYVVAEGKKVFSVRSYQQTFAYLLKKLNIPHKGFHALRHTFATRALECGMDVKTLSEILGHKSPTVTLNRYVHSMIDHKKNAMNKLGKSYLDL